MEEFLIVAKKGNKVGYINLPNNISNITGSIDYQKLNKKNLNDILSNFSDEESQKLQDINIKNQLSNPKLSNTENKQSLPTTKVEENININRETNNDNDIIDIQKLISVQVKNINNEEFNNIVDTLNKMDNKQNLPTPPNIQDVKQTIQGEKVSDVKKEGEKVSDVKKEGEKVSDVKKEGEKVLTVKKEGENVPIVKEENKQIVKEEVLKGGDLNMKYYYKYLKYKKKYNDLKT